MGEMLARKGGITLLDARWRAVTGCRQAAYLGKALLSAQLVQLSLLLARVEEDHELASRSQAGIPAVTQRHHGVQAVEPASFFLLELCNLSGLGE